MADVKPKGKDSLKEKPKSSPAGQQDIFVEIGGLFLLLFAFSSIFGGVMSAMNDSSIFKNGWSGLTYKGILLSNTRSMASVLNPIAGKVIVSVDSTDIFSDAGGKKIGTQKFGVKGKVIKGPVNISGKTYYYVDFESGVDGWVVEDGIAYINTELRSLKTSDPLGSTVLTAQDDTNIYNEPGGSVIDQKSKYARGVITKGPINKDGTNYYYVEFDDGVSGWVKQSDLLINAPTELSGLAKVLLFIWKLVTYIKYTLWGVVLVLVIFIFRILRSLTKVRVNMREKLFPAVTASSIKKSENPKWERVLNHIESVNENDWRLAIIEADIMLSELLETMHVSGESIGEKLKGIEKSDFTTLDLAWEAHKVRNQIAHAGGDFRISQREALRVVELYRAVFKEFQFV